MNTTETPQFPLPALNEGEVYAGAVFSPDGHGHHVILLPETKDECTWKAAMEFAAAAGGDLPSRIELQMLYAHARCHFEKNWYWSNETYEFNSAYAWFQGFGYGGQGDGRKGNTNCRARAVRRLVIQ